jgi:beta-lactamase class A
VAVSNPFPVEDLNGCAERFCGRVGFYARDLSTGAEYGWRPDDRFPTASVYKVPIMVELYRQAERGERDLDERRRVEPDIYAGGTGMLSLVEDAPEMTLRDYCRLMISISDNIATDMLLRVVGAGAVNAMLDGLGLKNIRVNMEVGRWHYAMVGMGDAPMLRRNTEVRRRFLGGEYDYGGVGFSDSLENNVSSARDMGVLLEKLHLGQLANGDSTEAMIAMLKSCAHRGMIPGHLKAAVEVGHKVGFSHRIDADAGIIYLSSGPMVVSAFLLASQGAGGNGSVIAEMTRLAVQAFSPDAIACEA